MPSGAVPTAANVLEGQSADARGAPDEFTVGELPQSSIVFYDAGQLHERLARIEAKVDALTDWSDKEFDTGQLITKTELVEIERREAERKAEYERRERARRTP